MKLNQTKTYSVFFTMMLMLTATISVSLLSTQVTAQTAPSLTINNGAAYTNSTTLKLTPSSDNATQMCFSSDNSSWSSLENYATSRNYTATEGDGNYTIYVQFLDSGNQSSFASSSIVLDSTVPEAIPYADWYSSDYRTVYFDASASTDNIGISNYTWNFGDSNTTNGITVIHTYAEAGNYTVALTVHDLAGNNATYGFNVNIPDVTAIPTPTPSPTYTIPPTSYPTITTQPTATLPPTTNALDSPWTLSVIAIVVIVVVGAVIVLALKRSSKPVP